MIIGSLIGIFGLIGLAEEIEKYRNYGSWYFFGLSLAVILIAVGGCLFYFGRQDRIKRKALEMALSMYRNYKVINTLQISSITNISEIELRKIILQAQIDGLLPENIEIV